ncbi:MAG: phage shock protein operon transcriptional activator [Parvularculaceae bacterium]
MEIARPSPPALIGRAPVFLDALAHISAAAPLNRPLLIIGERGAGKELLAARAHFLSSCWDGPLIKVNCAALSDDLLDSELFGHEAGAFTGAATQRAGKFELADGGTLFLDEIATASLRVQEKLLRVVEYGEFERVGGVEPLRVDVRIIGATNADLPALAARNAFRADLLDRLAFDVIEAPPLRARAGDIGLLAAHFGAAMTRELGRPEFPGFSVDAMRALESYHWPGNVRELKNVVERAVYRHFAESGDDLTPIDRIAIDPFDPISGMTDAHTRQNPPHRLAERDLLMEEEFSKSPSQPYDFKTRIAELEKRLVSDALVQNRGNQKRTAEYLSLTYDQLRGLMRKHGIRAGR